MNIRDWFKPKQLDPQAPVTMDDIETTAAEIRKTLAHLQQLAIKMSNFGISARYYSRDDRYPDTFYPECGLVAEFEIKRTL